MKDNASIEAEKARIRAERERGQADGYANPGRPLPGFYLSKTLIMLTAYERGFFVGREIAMEESD
jgi:hypothetical protein